MKRVVPAFDCWPSDLMLQKDGLGMTFNTCFKMLFQRGVRELAIGLYHKSRALRDPGT